MKAIWTKVAFAGVGAAMGAVPGVLAYKVATDSLDRQVAIFCDGPSKDACDMVKQTHAPLYDVSFKLSLAIGLCSAGAMGIGIASAMSSRRKETDAPSPQT